ncbi:hypothetical protein ABFA07_005056 [Porites harrisoni]
MTPEIEKLLPTKAKEVKNPVREKVLRREKNGEVIYFQEYKRMRQRICYVVLIKELNEAVLPAAVIFFIHEKTTQEVYTVLEILEVCNPPQALAGVTPHFMWVKKARGTPHTVLEVEFILETAAFLSGNSRNKCVVKSSNLFEKE